MSNRLEEAKKIFLDPNLDSDDIKDNKITLETWEKSLNDSEAILSWQSHEFSKNIVTNLRKAYKELGLKLATDRSLSEDTRKEIYRKQDACMFILSLMYADFDARSVINEINKQIQVAINAT